MKKTIALLLALGLLLGLAACGGGSTPMAASDKGGAPAETSAPTEEPASEPTEEPDAGEEEPIMGVYDPAAMTYVNQALGLGLALDEDWTVLNAEEIASLTGAVSEILTDEDAQNALDTSGVIFLFYAQAEEGLVTLNITMENLGLLYGALIDEEAYADISEDNILPSLEATGMTDLSLERVTLSFAGGEHPGFKLHGVLQEADFYETMVCVKAGKNMAVITAGSYLTDVTEDILALFYSA